MRGPLEQLPHGDRVQALVASLEHASAVLQRTCRDSTPFASLALELFDKAVRDVDQVVRLVERAATGHEADERGLSSRGPIEVISTRGLVVDEQERRREKDEERFDEFERPAALLDHGDEPRQRDPPSRRRTEVPGMRDRDLPDRDAPPQDPRIKRPSSSHSRRAASPARISARDGIFSSLPASGAPCSRASPGLDEPLAQSRAASRAASRVFSPPLPSAPPVEDPPQFSRRHGERKHSLAASPQSPRSPSPPPPPPPPPPRASAPSNDGYKRPKSRSSTAIGRPVSSMFAAPAPRRSSSRSRFAEESSSDEEAHHSRNRHGAEEADEAPSRSRARSKARSAARSHSGRSEDARRALELASAPMEDDEARADDVAPVRVPPVLSGGKIGSVIARAVAQQDVAHGKGGLLALCRVSREYRGAVTPLLYRTVTLASKEQLDRLSRTLESNPSLGGLVDALVIHPLDAHLPSPAPESLIPPLKALLDRLPSLTSLDEDFTVGDWDVGDLSNGHDYPLTVASPVRGLVRFRSAKSWWEIGALWSLLQSQPNLVELCLGGAAMDRDWVGTKLLAALSPPSPGGTVAPARHLESLEVAQVMHEDTLAVLLRATGASSSHSSSSTSTAGRLKSVRLGFQCVGNTDDDTPRASIPAALALVGSTVTHLALTAPSKASDDPLGLLDDVVAVLPRLEVLEWSEATDLAPVPLATPKLLARLPSSLQVLRARSLVSLSTSVVLSFLHDDAPRALRVVDESWYKARHVPRIEDTAAELGIECCVGKGDDPLVFRQA
ncbi:Proteophosphoglycan ppg4 [Rhodotorula diobovata]|uniref:Proteophosphoglycan ppg4 n=1 Tax=Rhodotorula diobovata TaxID=5288 RepID=A0A5C5FNF5_9BASI|nr:Proteophosphoglycan ppg4 [Rhodotorula diobovata]